MADRFVVEEEGVGALDLPGAESEDGPCAGALEDGDALRAESRAGHQDGHRAEFGPGAGGLVAVQSDRAVLDDRVVEAAERPLQFADELAVEHAHRHGRRQSISTMRLCPARRLRAAACGT